jgi:uncharacterized protein (TIGR02246 family)
MTADLNVRDAEVRALLDKQAIREAILRYCRGVDRGDADLVASAYFPDALDLHPGGHRFTGETIGAEMIESLAETFVSTSHSIGTQIIELDGDTAACESYSTGNHVMKDGRRLHTLVRYLDRLERRAGEWRITYRYVVVDQTDVVPGPDGAELGPKSHAARDTSDPSYTVFQGGEPDAQP